MNALVRVFIIVALLIPGIAFTNKNYRIVVLPFDKINKEKNLELETLSVGISETLSGALSNINNFIVIDSFRVKKYLIQNAEFNQAVGAESDKSIERLRKLAQEKLEGDYIVYGSFYKIGNKINLDAKFLNVQSGVVLKAASVHGAYPDKIFELQEDLAKKLTGAINGNVNERQTESMNEFISSTSSYEAYQYYIQARVEHLKYDVRDYPRAVNLYKKAIGKDPKFAMAWAGMSEVKALWSYQIKYAGGEYKTLLDQATQEGKTAVELGQNLYQTHRALSLAYVNNDDFENARKIIQRAYELNSRDPEILFVKATVVNYGYKDMATPGKESYKFIMECLNINPELIIARWSYAFSLYTLGKEDEALAEYEKILKINQRHAPSLHTIALIYYHKKDYLSSIQFAKRAAESDPDTPQHHYTLGLSYYGNRNWVEAEIALREAIKRKPGYLDAIYTLGGALYMQSRYKEARDAYAQVEKIKPGYLEAEKWRKISEEKIINKQ